MENNLATFIYGKTSKHEKNYVRKLIHSGKIMIGWRVRGTREAHINLGVNSSDCLLLKCTLLLTVSLFLMSNINGLHNVIWFRSHLVFV